MSLNNTFRKQHIIKIDIFKVIDNDYVPYETIDYYMLYVRVFFSLTV